MERSIQLNAIDKLRRILIPPRPNGRQTFDWTAVEAKVGLRLPADYKEFIELYGLGSVDDFLWVYHPTTTNRNLQLQRRMKEDLSTLRVLRDDDASLVPYAIFPEPGGLIPWGRTEDGDRLYWHARYPDPSSWTQVIREGRGPEWDEFHGPFAQFLTEVLTRGYVCPTFPRGFPSSHPSFRPYVEKPNA